MNFIDLVTFDFIRVRADIWLMSDINWREQPMVLSICVLIYDNVSGSPQIDCRNEKITSSRSSFSNQTCDGTSSSHWPSH